MIRGGGMSQRFHASANDAHVRLGRWLRRPHGALVEGQGGAGPEGRLDQAPLRAEGPSLIGTALYNADAALAAGKPAKRPCMDGAQRSQSRTQGGVGPVSSLLPGTRLGPLIPRGKRLASELTYYLSENCGRDPHQAGQSSKCITTSSPFMVSLPNVEG
jgi:hypothetical protein